MNIACPICFRNVGGGVDIGECEHVMCRKCYLEFTVERGNYKCPLCRSFILSDHVERAIGNRPFTRSLPMQVQTGVNVWFSRSLSRQLKQNISSEPISRTIFIELDEIFTEYPHVFCIVREDVLPIIHRAVMRHLHS